MKKKLFLILCLLLTVQKFSVCQTSVLGKSYIYYPADTVKILEYKDNKAIACTYSKQNRLTLFILIKPTGNTLLRGLQNCKVNDFVIDNDSLFFCGEDFSGNGIIGCFNITVFFDPSLYGPYYYLNNSILSCLSHVETLHKIVSFRDDVGIRHVIGIGLSRTIQSTNILKPCIAEFRGYQGVFFNYSTAIMEDCAISVVKDITIVGNYLVVAGFDANNSLNIRYFDKYNIFTPLGSEYDYYAYQLNNVKEAEWDTHDVILTTISENEFATAVIVRNKPPYKGSLVHIASYLLNPSSLSSPITMITSDLLSLMNNDNIKRLCEFKYNHTFDRYGLLIQGNPIENSNDSASCFFELDRSPFSLHIGLTDWQNDRKDLNSFDLFRNNQYYFMAGTEVDLPGLYYSIDRTAAALHCMDLIQCKISSSETLVHDKYTYEMCKTTNPLEMSLIHHNNSGYSDVDVDCSKYSKID